MRAAADDMVNPTMAKFGYPESCIAEYGRWVVLLREQQATLGALVLVCKGVQTAFGQIGEAAFLELMQVVAAAETALQAAFAYEKINYLMLMMIDPHVHFHVLPRYSGRREFMGVQFEDPGWPKLPELGTPTGLTADQRRQLRDHLRSLWPDKAR